MSSRADANPASSKDPGAGESSSSLNATAGNASQTRQSPVIPSSPPRLAQDDHLPVQMSEELGSGGKSSDSEAETIVLEGKENDRVSSPSSKQAIKHESDSDDEGQVHDDVVMKDAPEEYATKETEETSRIRPGKRRHGDTSKKDGPGHEAGNSSGLSSAPTSPAPIPQSSQEDGSESDQSSAPDVSLRERPKQIQKPRKRKLGEGGSDDDEMENRAKHGDARSIKERRETRSVTARPSSPKAPSKRRASNDRSLSPRVRTHRRAASTQSTGLNGHAPKKRKLPPPLQATRESKQSEDAHSDTSSADGSPHNSAQLRKMTSMDSSALSPAKMPPHKKHRDQIGRTFLARACANSELDAAKTRLKDRPQDVDEADYAGNTPLQIASLEGSVEIVKLLIESGCDVHCKNNEKDTPLIDAVENSHLEVVRLLLDAGANPKQGNAKGEEPLDLLDDENENYDAIRKALLSAIKSGNPRRQSEDHVSAKEGGRTSRGASTHSPRHSPTAAPPRSPQYSNFGARRRNARSEVSRNDLLWMSASQERLRELAGKGDLQGVGRILEMRPQSDTESFIAAARGGHDEVMQLLLAMGNAEPDPEPIKSATYKPGFNTPMLAAIGRGSDKVIKLLLEQQNFDPTRTDHRGRHYHEIAKERQGLGWEREYDLLKSSYERHSKGRKARLTQPGKSSSPEQPRQKGQDREGKRSSKLDSSSPGVQKSSKSPKEHRSEAGSTKHDSGKKENKRNSTESIASRAERSSKSGIPSKAKAEGRRAGSVAVSDGESTSLGPLKNVKVRRSESDSSRPRRKLISGAALKGDREKTRRMSSVSGSDMEEPTRPRHIKTESENSKDKDASRPKGDDMRTRVDVVRHEAAPKRPRESASPARSSSIEFESESRKARDDAKSKRRRIDSEGYGTNSKQAGHQSLKVRSTASSEPSENRGHPRNMDKMSQAKPASSADKSLASASSSPGVKRKASSGDADANPTKMRKRISDSADGDTPTNVSQGSVPKESAEAQKARVEAEAKAKAEKEIQRKLEQEREAQLHREQAESLARAQKKALEDRQQAEAARVKQEQADRKEAERQAKIIREREEAAERVRQIEEAERALRLAQEEEEARIEKKRREEEAYKRRLEQEQRRREEAERRRREAEERERIEQLRRQEDEERRRRAALPNKLRWQAEKPVHEIRTRAEAESFLPLMQAPLCEIDPKCSSAQAREMWIANYEAAAILGEKDLALSHCKSTSFWPFQHN